MFFLYPLAGAAAGVLAGLLGIGGGLVIVPMLVFCFEFQGIPADRIMQLALGTSLGSIMFTAVSSFWAHHKRGAVHWTVVARITPGILAGTYLGSMVAARLSTDVLKVFFVVFLYYTSFQLFRNFKPRPSRQLPGRPVMIGAGGVIGVVSSLVGIGGGTLSVPFLIWHNIPFHQAIGTSAAIGFPIALAGTVGYVVNGWNAAGLPALSWGFVSLPALAGIALGSVLTAPLGVRLAHRLPVNKLKKVFAALLLVVGTRMLISIL